MDTAPLLATLPLEQRLALAYSPRSSRDAMLALLALDSRLARVVRDGREPMLTQLRLAWWRDRFAADPESWPKGEPLLQFLRSAPLPMTAAVGLVDAWEGMVGPDQADASAQIQLIDARVAAFEALALTFGAQSPTVAPAARIWAEMDLATRNRAMCDPLRVSQRSEGRLPRAFRTLAILAHLARRAARRGKGELIEGPADLLVALRVGLFGI